MAIIMLIAVSMQAAKPAAKHSKKKSSTTTVTPKGHPSDLAYFFLKGPVKSVEFIDMPQWLWYPYALNINYEYNFDREGCYCPDASDSNEKKLFKRDGTGRITKEKAASYVSFPVIWEDDVIVQLVDPYSESGTMSLIYSDPDTKQLSQIKFLDYNEIYSNYTQDAYGNWVSFTDENGNLYKRKITYYDTDYVGEYIPVDTKIYEAVEEIAKFAGAQETLDNWITKNMRYPENARKNGVQGKVIVKAVIEKDGSISDVKIVRGVDQELNNEAIRLMHTMPKWTPAKNEGITVRSYYTLVIPFK